MTRRVFTSKTKKEQLEQQTLMLIRIIRRKLDKDVLDKAQEIAIAAHNADKLIEKKVKSTEALPFNKENAKAAVAKFLVMNRGNPALCQKILKEMNREK